MKRNYSQEFLRRRKFLTVLPLLVLPFITLAFWSLDGGKGDPQINDEQTDGLNVQLPGANLKEDNVRDKMSFYEQAERDSMKRLDEMRSDPYFKLKVLNDPTRDTISELYANPNIGQLSDNKELITSPYGKSYSDPNEEKVMRKLDELNKEINKPQLPRQSLDQDVHHNQLDTERFSDDVDRLENMMQGVTESDVSDPEMGRIEGMLNKILDIQHPERLKEKMQERSLQNKSAVFPVKPAKDDVLISVLERRSNKAVPDTIDGNTANRIGFFGSDEIGDEWDVNAIEAVIQETQMVVNGGLIKMRLLSDIYIQGNLVPKGNLIFGLGTVNGERLQISICSLRYQNSIYPIALEVYDMDGLPGIFIPGAINRDAVKDATDNVLQRLNMGSLNPSVSAQAATAGIDAAKNLLSKKTKLVRVTLKAGYRLLLKDNNQQ